MEIQAVAKIQYPIKSHITKAKGKPLAFKTAEVLIPAGK